MEAITWQIESGRVMRFVKMKKNIPDPSNLVGPDAALVILFEQALQTFVPESL